MNRHQEYRVWLITAVVVTMTIPLETALGQTRATSHDDVGRSTFVAKGCARCHAIYGHGFGDTKPKGGPDLGKRGVYGTYMELAASMWNHFPDMVRKAREQGKQFPSFSDQDVNDVISFLAYIRYRGQPGNERTGRKLLRQKNCMKCHAIGGEGGDKGPDFTKSDDYLTPLGLAAAMWNHGPNMMDIFTDNNIKRPALTGPDIVDLSAGIRSFMVTNRVPVGSDRPGDPERGRVLVNEKRCNYCHGGPSGAKGAPMDFRDMVLKSSVTEIAGNMWNHGPAMWESMRDDDVAFPTLSATEIADIIAFLYEMELQDPPGDPGKGAELVYDKGCVNCHSVDGKGAGVATSFSEIEGISSPISMISLMWNHAEDMIEAARDRGHRWPEFQGSELGDIYAYLRQLAGEGQAN